MKEYLESTSEELMAKVRRGDLTAFEELYNRFHKPLYQFILRFVKEKPIAEEVLQETFLRIFKERKGYKQKARFSTYLFTIGRNLCLDILKTRGKRPLLSDQENYIQRARDLSIEPSEIVEEAEISAIVQREIQALPRDQREVIILSKYSSLSCEEIARIVESTPNAVKQKVYRAMRSLRRKLKNLRE